MAPSSRTVRFAGIVVVATIALISILRLSTTSSASSSSHLDSLSKYFNTANGKPAPSSVPDSFYYDFDSEETSVTAVDAGTSASAISPLPASTTLHERANATLLMLARNSDVDGAVSSVRDVEDRFNRKFGYPWVFMNEEPFSEDFKKRVSILIQSPVTFLQIPHDHWYQPEWIDEARATDGRNKMVMKNIIYGGSVSYRNMCRFNSGFFFKHEFLQQYRWYWRVEPDIHFHCDIDFDPFVYMQAQNKTYGFTISMFEFEATITTLWSTVREFTNQHPEYVAEDNSMDFVSDNGGSKYNLCHFWSNFEIADMDFWRSEAYTKFFDYLDSKGGFYYERWGDAPVHSIAAALFLRKDQIHFFREIGYEHNPFNHCPQEEDLWRRGRCSCNPEKTFDWDTYSCLARWERLMES
ncbi:glycosyl transferase [Stereum hirsutum FP-91666 SS1]|uniref:glycosyl transferase n=1 Tax=Stereum hirsutum (strain FP-91666) TaxID=721885 RepID=UPI0004449E70|nr:glycosyl transferase [Stereum hirsutum FP-91666 SS1]EIM84738.1 glycosyl transferase [Stereum hirsutum FP-91666 SS1]